MFCITYTYKVSNSVRILLWATLYCIIVVRPYVRVIQSGTKINGHVVEIFINEISLNTAYLCKNESINFNYLLNNLCTLRIYNK